MICVKRNYRMRNKIIIELLGFCKVDEVINKTTIGWWEHMKRINSNRMVKRMFESKLTIVRRVGRPRKRLIYTILYYTVQDTIQCKIKKCNIKCTMPILYFFYKTSALL